MDTRVLKRIKEDWDNLGSIDPLWAILTKERSYKWSLEEFLKTGVRETKSLIKKIKVLNPNLNFGRVLDFGCGVGRIAKPLKNHFKEYFGVDISNTMIRLAKEVNKNSNCIFLENFRKDLEIFPKEYFDFVYSNLVLQHIPDKKLIKIYIAEFVRVLKKDGILIFQLPSYTILSIEYFLRKIAYRTLKKLGFKERSLYNLNIYPLCMNSVPKKKVVSLLKSLNIKILKIENNKSEGKINMNKIYYIKK
jgi:ubiquinone/menaquinone biosynthesis C-methylase UbiE